jgi:hypothetical protein
MSLSGARQGKRALGFLRPDVSGGEGIRTPDTLTGITDFKSVAFNRSATPPVVGKCREEGFRSQGAEVLDRAHR